MIEAVIILAVVCAIQAVVLAMLPFLLWRFTSQHREQADMRKDLDALDEVVERLIERMGGR